MVRYLSLISFTDQGVRAVDQSCQRAAGFRQAVESKGGKVVAQYWMGGEFDGACLFEAPDELTANGLLLALAKLGHVRTRSMRVFDENEFQWLLSQM